MIQTKSKKKFQDARNNFSHIQVLRDASKRQMYDARRSGGGSMGWGQTAEQRQHQRRSGERQWTAYSQAPNSDNRSWEYEYWPNQSHPKHKREEEFMNWYRSNYHDIFSELEEVLAETLRAEAVIHPILYPSASSYFLFFFAEEW